MRYFVTGFGKSGSSMLMQCLWEGGMPINGNTKLRSTGHHRHPWGKFENGSLTDWPDGSVKKHLDLNALPLQWDYLALFIFRNPEEMGLKPVQWHNWPHMKNDKLKWLVEHDIPTLVIDYNKIIDDPYPWMVRIRDHGFPIDVDRAARVPTPEMNHSRK